jgi:hypothetical protein
MGNRLELTRVDDNRQQVDKNRQQVNENRQQVDENRQQVDKIHQVNDKNLSRLKKRRKLSSFRCALKLMNAFKSGEGKRMKTENSPMTSTEAIEGKKAKRKLKIIRVLVARQGQVE